VAKDGEGRNSPYTSALIEYIKEPGLPITDVFMKVRQKLRREVGQVPWEVSSLEGKFYFSPQGSQSNNLSDGSTYATDSTSNHDSEAMLREKAALEQERQELARVKQELERQKVLDAEREQLAAERRKIEAERKQLALGPRPTSTGPRETARDGRFIAYDNGTVLDTKTNLMWAAKDNGTNTYGSDAKTYSENYRGGGYKDWRLPTLDELAELYHKNKSRPAACNASYEIHVATELIDITCNVVFASEIRGYETYFIFQLGERGRDPKSFGVNGRALPVRSAK
jgi:hypothetical protein